MGWADFAIETLKEGKDAIIKPTGNSMRGKVESGSKVTLEPISLDKVQIGDIVLCKVKGNQYLHLVKAIDKGRFLIGNNRGGINGWTKAIYGIVTKIEKPNEKANKKSKKASNKSI
jgi:hypothetical protein